MSKTHYRFTVWTATYNRAKYLKRVYLSLVNQTFKDFEWIIVDDGSTDNTEEIVTNFISQKIIKSIKYLKKSNGGKHTAWRLATENFSGSYIITVDSDDALTNDALDKFDKHWKALEGTDNFSEYWEVKGRIQYNGKILGRSLPSKVFDSNYDEIIFRYRIKEDMLGCRKIDILKNEARIPDSFKYEKQCNNFPESIRWSRAGKKYKTRYVDEIVLKVFFDTDDSLTSGYRKKRSSRKTYNTLIGAKYTLEERREEMLKWDVKSYFMTILELLYSSICLSLNPLEIVSFPKFADKFLIIVLYYPVWVLHKFRG